MRIPIVGVICSGTTNAGKPARRAREIGEWLATQRVHLLTGGGRGLMAVVSSAFHGVTDRDGLVIGIVPCEPSDPGRPKHGYPNRWVEIPIYTHLPLSGARGTDPLSRNHINVLTSNVIIALPGRKGTLSEIVLALKYKPRAVAAYLTDRSEIPDLPEEVPVFDELREIQAFVRSALKRAPK
jgi:uncharacterized protein (TIGR00725 family)